MRVDDFDYRLPEELIAQQPLEERSASRMLVLYRNEQRWEDRMFREFPSFLRAGDCLIVNNSRVFPSRLFGQRSSGTALIEVFLLRALSEDQLTWEALVRPGRKVPVGERLRFSESLAVTVLSRGEHGQRILRFDAVEDIYAALNDVGHMPLPPYIKRPDSEADRLRYQTVFARATGSVAAPTAGLHFTTEILQECERRGAAIAQVTLHVGLGTFQPLHTDIVENAKLHAERYEISTENFERIRTAERRIAVGTTSVRTVESAYSTGQTSGETSIFIYPGYRFQAIDALVTNFHLPKSSLLMLVCALGGREFVLAAYQHAVQQRYRFFSYGDCMLIL
jgi:S-adenosylmethionine:tRNA ribosyltransferase-isomerase